MRRAISCVLLVSWGLWFGGMMVLFLFVMRLFTTDRAVATHAAPVLFQSFAIYQIIVGMIACGCGTLLVLLTGRKALAVATLLMVGAMGLALIINMWTDEMLTLDRSAVADVARFQTLHHNTTNVYTTSAVLLLIAGIIGAITLTPSLRRKAGETAPATGSPDAIAD